MAASGSRAKKASGVLSQVLNHSMISCFSSRFFASTRWLRAIISELEWNAFSAGMSVTMSAGVTVLHANENSDNVLARADSALYAAKAQGRNRINTA